MKKKLTVFLSTVFMFFAFALPAAAADYAIDSEGMHASIHFRMKHLGYSWLLGRFNDFEGTFTYDEADPAASSVQVTIDTASVDSNHEKRDKHLREEEVLNVAKYPTATFKSTSVTAMDDGSLKVTGDLTLRGVTKEIVIDASKVGEGKDPWGGYRAGFTGETAFSLKDFGIPLNLGPVTTVYMELNIEGVRQ